MARQRVGLASMAHHHAEHYAKVLATLPDVELVGFSDDDPVRSCRVAEETGLHQFSTLDELLSQDLDLAVVCSENSRHRKDVTLAAHRGVSVLVEKPLATSAQDARALILACREAGVNLRTAFPMRFSYPLVSLAGLVRTGRLGRPLVVVSANQGQVPDAIRPWFTVADLAGGGALTDHTVHLLDYCRWLLDDEVATVYAQVAGSVGSGAPVERFALVALRFTGGTIVTIDASWSRPVSFPSWGGLRLTVSGTAGRADADAFGEHLSVYSDRTGISWPGWGVDSNLAMLTDFLALCRGEPSHVTDELDGWEAALVVEAAYISAREHRWVQVDRNW